MLSLWEASSARRPKRASHAGSAGSIPKSLWAPSASQVLPHGVCLPDESHASCHPAPRCRGSRCDASSPYPSTLQTQVVPPAGGKAASYIPKVSRTRTIEGLSPIAFCFLPFKPRGPGCFLPWFSIACASSSCWAQAGKAEVRELRINTVRTCAELPAAKVPREGKTPQRGTAVRRKGLPTPRCLSYRH